MALEVKVKTVTAQEAQALLEKQAPNQRRRNESRVNQYEREMSAGRWYPEVSVIQLNGDGSLQNGGHRLAAQVLGGHDVQHIVVTGTPSNAIAYIDQGRSRTLGDALVIRGLVEREESGPIASLTGMLCGTALGSTGGRAPATLSDRLTFAEANLDAIRAALEVAKELRAARAAGLQDGVVAFLVYRATEIGELERFKTFLLDATMGDGPDGSSNAAMLRKAYTKALTGHGPKRNRTWWIAVTIKAFGKELAGEESRQIIRWSPKDGIPKMRPEVEVPA